VHTKSIITAVAISFISTGASAQCKQKDLTGKWAGMAVLYNGAAECLIAVNNKGKIIPGGKCIQNRETQEYGDTPYQLSGSMKVKKGLYC
jgi:hypothetical protein